MTPLVSKMQLRTESSKAYPLKAAEPVEIRWQNSSFLVGTEKLKGERLQLAPAVALPDDAHFALAGRSYRGILEILAKKGGLTAVNLVPLDDYLLSVVPEEMPTDWPAEALKAQSIAARSFALHNRDRHGADGFDLCTTTHCQVYTGVGAEKTASTAAIKATEGEVLFYGTEPIDALFHTDSGGMTENSENVWGALCRTCAPLRTRQPKRCRGRRKSLLQFLNKNWRPRAIRSAKSARLRFQACR